MITGVIMSLLRVDDSRPKIYILFCYLRPIDAAVEKTEENGYSFS